MAMITTAERDTSGNPALGSKTASALFAETAPRTMTVGGTSFKTLFLLLVLIGGGARGWASATTPVATDLGGGFGNTTVTIPGGFWLASFGAFFVAIFLAVNPRRAALLGVVYAVLQGYCLGAISAAFDAQTDGIVAAAILSTVAVFIVALLLYVTRIVKPTQKLAFGVIVGLGGLSLLYLFVWVLSIFDWDFLYSDHFRTVGIIVTVIAVVLAALSLTLDLRSSRPASRATRRSSWSGTPRTASW
jgi:uncharacterized YccA/Bax inhibitor family protein